MRKCLPILITSLSIIAATTAAQADMQGVRGKVIQTQGHVSPNCRVLIIRRSDNGNTATFRIAGTNQEDGVLANALTAIATGLDVSVWFDPTVTTGCGGEPEVTWIEIHAAGT